MKEHARTLVRGLDPLSGRNVLREYLQARVLEGLQKAGAMSPLAFQGGTALRFLYGLPRYSEDLDFALEGSSASYDLGGWTARIIRQFRREGYEVAGSVRDRGSVHASWVRFRGLLHEAGLSPHRSETLGVRIDVDTGPPEGAVTATRLVRRHVSLRLHHHDRASLLAGRLHSVLCRPWTKGRDIFDLAWYLSDASWPEPNLELLRAALRQTGVDTGPISAEGWRRVVAGRVAALPWGEVSADAWPFLGGAESLPSREEVLGLLKSLPDPDDAT